VLHSGSIPDEVIGFFFLVYLISRAMVLGFRLSL
jgi:hypothetical protein